MEQNDNGTIVVEVLNPVIDTGLGIKDYEKLNNKPKINDVLLVGNKTLSELGIQPKGDYITQNVLTEQLAEKANKDDIPVNVSQLNNDSKYVNEDDMNLKLDKSDLPAAIDTALQQAKESGEFDGYSPSAKVEKAETTTTITITDKDGTTTAQVKDGVIGHDGFSPDAKVTQDVDGATITVTDKAGTTTAKVLNGKDGVDGESGVYVGADPVPEGTKVQVDPSAEGFILPDVLQTTGNSTDDTMSQDAITKELAEKANKTEIPDVLNFATKQEVTQGLLTKVDKVYGSRLMTDAEGQKLNKLKEIKPTEKTPEMNSPVGMDKTGLLFTKCPTKTSELLNNSGYLTANDVGFVSFEIEPTTGILKLNTAEGFTGANFNLNKNGELEVKI